MNGLLNHEKELQLPDGSSLCVFEVLDGNSRDNAGCLLSCVMNGETRWRVPILGIGEDPTSNKNNSGSCDFAAKYWSLFNSVAIAGESKLILINCSDGRVAFEDRPELIQVGGLDKLEILVSANGSYLIFISTKKIIVVGNGFEKICQQAFRGPIKTAQLLNDDTLSIWEYDVSDVQMPLREKLLNLQTCEYRETGRTVPTI